MPFQEALFGLSLGKD